jgi:hypothetical protein
MTAIRKYGEGECGKVGGRGKRKNIRWKGKGLCLCIYAFIQRIIMLISCVSYSILKKILLPFNYCRLVDCY